MWGKAEGDPYNSDEQPQESKPTRLRARLGASLVIAALLGATARGGWLVFAGPTVRSNPLTPPNSVASAEGFDNRVAGVDGIEGVDSVDAVDGVDRTVQNGNLLLPSVPFAVRCRFSHESNDDPLLLPGQPGRSHPHSFFGNATTNASSTVSSLLGQATSCDHPADTAAYWLPSPVGAQWTAIRAYYRDGDLPASSVSVFPPGFSMIGGTPPKAMAPMASMASMGETTGATHRVKKSTGVELGQRATWSCGRSIDESGWTVAIPNCAQGTALAARIVFGQCASTGSPGLNETVFAVQGSCPSTHPFGVAQLRIRAEITARPTAFSSGPLTSLHADFLNAWDQTSLENLHTVCIRGQRDADQIKQCGLAGTGPRVTGFG